MKVISNKKISLCKLLNTLLICSFLVGFVTAQEMEGMPMHDENASEQETNKITKFTIPELAVQTQDGKNVNFFKDLVKGKKVLISFVYTSCNMTCPMVGRNFDKLQKVVGEDLGKDIFLITVTTDPETDTPQVLKTWGEKFNRKDGWTLVTGDKKEMGDLLMTLTGSGPQRGLHTSFLILFDETTGNWETSSSLLAPTSLLNKLNELGKPKEK